jgi:hypothetical protein
MDVIVWNIYFPRTMVGGSLRVLRLLPPIKLGVMILLKYCWKWRWTSQIKSILQKLMPVCISSVYCISITLFWVESRVHLFCNLQSRARTHAVLVIGLYELLGNVWSNPGQNLVFVMAEYIAKGDHRFHNLTTDHAFLKVFVNYY